MLKFINPFSKVIATMLLASIILQSCVTQETDNYVKSLPKTELSPTYSTLVQENLIEYYEKKNAEGKRDMEKSKTIIKHSKLQNSSIRKKLTLSTKLKNQQALKKPHSKKIIKEKSTDDNLYSKPEGLAKMQSNAVVVATKASSKKMKEQPIYKKKLTTTDHRQTKYKVALVDPTSENTLSNFTIETRENYKIELFKDEAQWMALLQDNKFPGFTRNLTLPVLYELVTKSLSCKNFLLYTVEQLMTSPNEKIHKILHIVLPENANLHKGFIYLGHKMGLKGGGFWGWVGCAVGAIVCVVAVCVAAPVTISIGAAVIFNSAAISTSVAIGVCALGGAAFGYGFGNCFDEKETQRNVTYAKETAKDETNRLERDRENKDKEEKIAAEKGEKEKEELEKELKKQEEERKRQEEIKRIVREKQEEKTLATEHIKNCRTAENDAASKTKTILETFDYTKVLDSIKELNRLMGNITNAVIKLDNFKTNCKHPSEIEYMVQNSRTESNRAIQAITGNIQIIISTAEAQALVILNENENAINRVAQENNAGKALEEIMRVNSNIIETQTAIQDDITSLKVIVANLQRLAQEPAIFHQNPNVGKLENRTNLENAINAANRDKRMIEIKRELLHFGNKDIRNAQLIERITTAEDIVEHEQICIQCTILGELLALKYLLECVHLSPNIRDENRNTLLHISVEYSHIPITTYLLSLGANASIKGRRSMTPLDLAKKNNNIPMIELLQG